MARDLNFLCGDHTIDSHILYKAVKHDLISSKWVIRDHNQSPVNIPVPPKKAAATFSIRRTYQGTHWMGSFKPADRLVLASLNMIGVHDCFLAQDRVLGIIGLISEADLKKSGIRADPSTTVPELYTQFSKHVLLSTDPSAHYRWWEYLSRAFTFKRTAGLPSWVPDLHHQSMDDGHTCVPYRSIREFGSISAYFKASSLPGVVTGGLGPEQLVIRGKLLDRVIYVHDEITLIPDSESEDMLLTLKWLVSLARWEQRLARRVLHGASDEGANDIGDHQRISENTYWRTLLADVSNASDESTSATGETLHLFRARAHEIHSFLRDNTNR